MDVIRLSEQAVELVQIVHEKERGPVDYRPMKRSPGGPCLALSLLCSAAPAASAGDLELAAHAGSALPSYGQSFRLDPGLIPLPPGVSIEQEGVFRLDARGGLAVGGGLTWYLAGPVGLEARLDSAGVDVRTQEARFTVELRPPAPLPPVVVSVEPTGSVDLDRLTPVSLNFKVCTPGRLRFALSAGASWLLPVSFTVTQTIGLGLGGAGAGITIPAFTLRASGGIDGAIGVNAGAGLQIAVGGKVSLSAEGRFFYFPERTLTWTRLDDRSLSASELALAQELLSRLGPVEFSPSFFQATAGIAVRF